VAFGNRVHYSNYVSDATTLCVLECLQAFARMCKYNYDLTPELLGVKYQDTCHSTKCFEVSDATILI